MVVVVDAGGQDRVQLGGVGGEDPAPGWYYIYIYIYTYIIFIYIHWQKKNEIPVHVLVTSFRLASPFRIDSRDLGISPLVSFT